MMPTKRFFGMIVAMGLLVGACGPSNEPKISTEGSPILYGTPVNSGEHQEVVMVVDTVRQTLCSGTLIAPRVVLTAAHCFNSGTNNLGVYSVEFGTNYWEDAVPVPVAEVSIHPQYDSADFTDDIALIRLAKAAPSGALPIPNLPSSIEITSKDVGTELEFVGFGDTSIILSGNGIKMQVDSPLMEVCTDLSGCSWHSSAYKTVSNTICVELINGGPYGGDSGGPAFITRGNQVYVAGTVAFSGSIFSVPCYACCTKVDQYESFIDGFLKAGLGLGCSQDDECESNHCAEEVCCETSCSDSCQACNLPGSLGTCMPVPEGATCDDGVLCNGFKTCTSNTCTCHAVSNNSGGGCDQVGSSPGNSAWLLGLLLSLFCLRRRYLPNHS